MPVFIKVNFTKQLAIKKGNLVDLSNNFKIVNNLDLLDPPGVAEDIHIDGVTIVGNSVNLQIPDNQVPKTGNMRKSLQHSRSNIEKLCGLPRVTHRQGKTVECSEQL